MLEETLRRHQIIDALHQAYRALDDNNYDLVAHHLDEAKIVIQAIQNQEGVDSLHEKDTKS